MNLFTSKRETTETIKIPIIDNFHDEKTSFAFGVVLSDASNGVQVRRPRYIVFSI